MGLLQVDLDLGNYERFLDITLTRDNNLTTGKVYQVLSSAPLSPHNICCFVCCLLVHMIIH